MKTLQARNQRLGFANVAISRIFTDQNPAGALLYNQISAYNTQARPNMQDDASYVTPDDVKASGVRFQVLASDLDPVFPPALLKSVAKDIDATYVCIGDAGHSTYFEKPDVFNAALYAFLASIGLG